MSRNMSFSEPGSQNDILKEKLKTMEAANKKRILDDENLWLYNKTLFINLENKNFN